MDNELVLNEINEMRQELDKVKFHQARLFNNTTVDKYIMKKI